MDCSVAQIPGRRGAARVTHAQFYHVTVWRMTKHFVQHCQSIYVYNLCTHLAHSENHVYNILAKYKERREITQSHACPDTHTHTNTCTHTLSLARTHTLSLLHTHTLSLSLAHTLSFLHEHSLAHTHTHTHTHTLSLAHTHTHTLSLSLSLAHMHTLTGMAVFSVSLADSRGQLEQLQPTLVSPREGGWNPANLDLTHSVCAQGTEAVLEDDQEQTHTGQT